ncbi:hypothetical protein F4782DRAFT_79353, partial [Xylaria castorea]
PDGPRYPTIRLNFSETILKLVILLYAARRQPAASHLVFPPATQPHYCLKNNTRKPPIREPRNLNRYLVVSSITLPPNMFALSEESKERIGKIIEISKVAMHYGYLPLILYLGAL